MTDYDQSDTDYAERIVLWLLGMTAFWAVVGLVVWWFAR